MIVEIRYKHYETYCTCESSFKMIQMSAVLGVLTSAPPQLSLRRSPFLSGRQ